MSVTLSMWLGVAFLALCVVAVVLQAWLWNPKYWDPVAKKSHAPRFWMFVHRAVGYAYAAIYVVMMYYMVPRLWEYQVELPARTVIHAVAAITIGVVLVTKIMILRFFRHFEEAMPALGMVLLVCTILLGSLSLPFAFRAHGSAEVLAEENRERVQRILEPLALGEGYTAAGLASVSSLERGREVVVRECTLCHDLRTILSEPRTGAGWLSLCRRMQDKPTLGRPMSDESIRVATAYLIAITPNLRDDAQRRRDEEQEREAVVSDLDLALDAVPAAAPDAELAAVAVIEPEPALAADAGLPTDGGVAPATGGEPAAVAAAPSSASRARARRLRARRRARARARASAAVASAAVPAAGSTIPTVASAPRVTSAAAPEEAPARPTYSPALARQLLQRACTDCHGLSDIDEHGGDDRAGWAGVMRRMIQEGAELTSDEARILVTYLAARYPIAQ